MSQSARVCNSVFYENARGLLHFAAKCGVVATLLVPTVATAGACKWFDGDKVAEKLAELDEHPVAFGMQPDGTLLQIYATADGETYTVVVARPDGAACVLAAGEHWTSLPVEIAGPRA